MLYGNGFIAAFVAGLFLGVESTAIRERIREFGEAEGQQLALFIFLVFGIVMVPLAYEYWDWTALVYAMLSLTIVRMVPIALSLSGSEAGWREMMFYGWFGPRGIASILYLLMVVGSLGIDGHQYAMSVIILTVMLSIILHGVSAIPFVNIYQRSTGK
jgi:NhaP-type Na+/H+ or K+/H+ antiporter